MGEPIGDANDPADEFPDAPEGNDGLLDIYVVAGLVGGQERSISTDALAETNPARPRGGPTTPRPRAPTWSWTGPGASGVALQSTIVHELFHAFQYAHNNSGLMVAGSNGGPGRATGSWRRRRCGPSTSSCRLPVRVRSIHGSRASRRRRWGSHRSRASTSTHPGCGRCSCARRRDPPPSATHGSASKASAASTTSRRAIGQLVPFEDRFGDFAVRAYDVRLEPGDPIDPAFWDVDPTFPDQGPVDPRAENDVDVPPDGKLERTISMPPLWSHATDLITDGIPTVTFDFDELTSGTNVSVDLLVQTKKDGWQRRPGNIGKVCDAERVS